VEVPLLSEAPKADIVLLRREGERWSPEQRQWLADGLRHANEKHFIIEFKYTEGLNLKALQQLNAYDYFYVEGHELKPEEVACFLVVASTPMGDWKGKFGFSATERQGVYRGNISLLKRVQIILLNELEATEHNAPLKCFASRHVERKKAFVVLRDSGFMRLSGVIERLITGLWRLSGMLNVSSTPHNMEELTPEMVIRMGQEWIDALLDATPVDEVLNHYKADEVLNYYKADEVLNHYEPEQRLAGLGAEQRLAGLEPEQRLAGLTEEQIRAYLELLQQRSSQIN
jgi:hypothetical protein